jgi:pantoate--beta-alanine ligase
LKILRSVSVTARFCREAKGPVVLVPTMGALHRGHAALIDRARALAGPEGTVVVSIFVNPTQFGPKEDLARYPRPFAADRKLCAEHGADLIFHPSPEEMYPEGFSTYVEESDVSAPLCGASRPGHFRGVCTVVLKLFQITQPAMAVFGLKDFQQCAVIRRMVRDLNLPVKIVPAATVREADGLALSSRNRYLSREERVQAPILRKALLRAGKAFLGGETSAAKLRQLLKRTIATAPLACIDYVEIADSDTLQPVKQANRDNVVALAVFFGRTRLIDNLLLRRAGIPS